MDEGGKRKSDTQRQRVRDNKPNRSTALSLLFWIGFELFCIYLLLEE